MSKKRKIDEIYNILKQFEQINNPDSFITEFSWLNYLDRLYIYLVVLFFNKFILFSTWLISKSVHSSKNLYDS